MIIAAILAALIILFAVSYNLQGDETAVGKAARSLVSAVQRPLISLSDRITGNGDEKKQSELDRLKNEVEELKRELQIASLSREEYDELKALTEGFSLTDSAIDKKPVAANVVSYDNISTFNLFTIDAGSESGIVRNTVVISGDGLIGRVLSSDKGWAKVVTITDENNKVGFQVKEEKDGKQVNFIGVCSGDGEGNLTGQLLDEEGFAKEGDPVITSGLGDIYPGGITIGKVTKAEYTQNSQLMEITIEPSAYFRGLRKVVVLT
jgi:rod shape-determining protein MreC